MKAVIVQYRRGLGDYLDENRIEWEMLTSDSIMIRYVDEKQLFNIAFEAGRLYEKQSEEF